MIFARIVPFFFTFIPQQLRFLVKEVLNMLIGISISCLVIVTIFRIGKCFITALNNVDSICAVMSLAAAIIIARVQFKQAEQQQKDEKET